MKKPLNIVLQNQSKIRVGVLLAFVLIVFGALCIEFFQAVRQDAYFVAHEDEVIYYGSAKVFAETGSLQAESCINEDVSPLGKFNWYGPGYNVVYGSLLWMFGQSNTLFIKIHFALALLTLVVIFLMPLSFESKLLAASILLTAEQFTCYIFSYFPEMLQLFFAAVLVIVLLQLYRKQPDERSNTLVLYVTLILLFSLCRVTTIFWLAALLPLGSNWRARVPFIIIFIVGIVGSVIYLRFCIAPPYAGEMHKLQNLYSFSLMNFVFETIKATARNAIDIFKVNSVPIYILLLLIGLTIYNYWKTKDKFQLAAFLISFCLVGTLMAYYSVNPFYFVKQTAMLLPLLVVSFMRGPHISFKWILFSIFIYLWIPVNKKRTKVIEEHKAAYSNLENNRPLAAAFSEIEKAIQKKGNVFVLWCYNEFDYGNAAQALLPYATKYGKPIMYTTNIVDKNSGPDSKFLLHHKLKVDYILSKHPLVGKNLSEVLKTEFFYLYELPEN